MKLRDVPNVAWLGILTLAVLNNLLFHFPLLDVICAILSLLLATFYFYSSFFYFLHIPIGNWRKALNELSIFEKIFGFLIGLPFALTSISITFIILRFPGSQIMFVMGVFFFLVIIVLLKSNLGNELSLARRNFATKNLWLDRKSVV